MKILSLLLFLQLLVGVSVSSLDIPKQSSSETYTLTNQKDLYGNMQFYLSTPDFSEDIASDISKELSDKNIRCVISGSDDSSLRMADYLVLKLPGVNWFGVDPKISTENLSRYPRKYPGFREKYPISPAQTDSPLRIPLDCNRPLVITTEKELQRLLSREQRLLPGSISRTATDKHEFGSMRHLHNTSSSTSTNAFDYLCSVVDGIVYG